MALVLLASGCRSNGEDREAAPSPTVRTEPTPTTAADPYAVPAVIDVAYVNRVLAGSTPSRGKPSGSTCENSG